MTTRHDYEALSWHASHFPGSPIGSEARKALDEIDRLRRDLRTVVRTACAQEVALATVEAYWICGEITP